MENKEVANKSEKPLLPQEVVFTDSNCNALLTIRRPEIPERILREATKFGLQEKPEFHISIIASRNGKAIADLLSKTEDEQKIREQIKNDFITTQWQYELIDSYCLLEKFYDAEELKKSGYEGIPEHKRFTLIQQLRLDELKDYYERLTKLTGIKFDKPYNGPRKLDRYIR